MVVLPKNSNFSRGVGGGKKSWTIAHLTQQWSVHASIVAQNPNDLERHYAAGLALQMAGQSDNADEEYILFCREAECYHITITEACKYYSEIKEGMEGEGLIDEDVEYHNICGRIKLLKRYEKLKKDDKKIVNQMKAAGCSIS
ncbi:hypothetical protein TrLO_g15561 [Triparma laevis f. longispina]|uniref:Uncharacterized protein n=1 Tax=Triparma laevis f. longispina TaxID=1714387 RepID=A0A9W7AHP1_9STRA|nr:hypothetical protein TrLO_g15561 [Triparma laevis f. longispina]